MMNDTGVIFQAKSRVTVVVLTRDEEPHIERCLRSCLQFARRVVIVDSGSTDRTIEIAEALGAQVLRRPWINHAEQFNWALTQLTPEDEWVMRLDADEYVTGSLSGWICAMVGALDKSVAAVCVRRRIIFMGRWIRYGGIYPLWTLRIFRRGAARAESRWMDEQIIVLDGRQSVNVAEDIVDENLRCMSWWVEKHNRYASLEAISVVSEELRGTSRIPSGLGASARFRRWLKVRVYPLAPPRLRALMYFLFRYIFLGGFLDGRVGVDFHILQGFWYRFLVDVKVSELRHYLDTHTVDLQKAAWDLFGVRMEGGR